MQVFESEHLQRHGCCYVETMEGFSLGSAMKMGKVRLMELRVCVARADNAPSDGQHALT